MNSSPIAYLYLNDLNHLQQMQECATEQNGKGEDVNSNV